MVGVVQGPGDPGRCRPVQLLQRVEPPRGVVEEPADHPGPPHGGDEAVGGGGVAGSDRAAQGDVDLVGLRAQPGQPAELVGAPQVGLGGLGQLEHDGGVGALGTRPPARLVEPLACVLADRLQHAVAGVAVRLRDRDDERLVHERREQLERPRGRARRARSTRVRPPRPSPAGEHREPPRHGRAPARSAGPSSSRPRRRSVWWRGRAVRLPPVSSWKRSSSRGDGARPGSSGAGAPPPARSASGRPSRRRQISATASWSSGVSVKPGSAAAPARRRAGRRGSRGSPRRSRSELRAAAGEPGRAPPPGTPSGSRLVASTRSAGRRCSRSSRAAAAASTRCSQLSSTSSEARGRDGVDEAVDRVARGGAGALAAERVERGLRNGGGIRSRRRARPAMLDDRAARPPMSPRDGRREARSCRPHPARSG